MTSAASGWRSSLGVSRFILIFLILQAVPTAQAVCWFEGKLFEKLLRRAGSANDARLAGYSPLERTEVTAPDGTKLRGLLLRGSATEPRRRLLFVQGDAMLADQVLPLLQRFQAAGFDAFVFDYRGFGRSDGQPSIEAIANDYEVIIHYLQTHHPGPRFYYAISGGGVVLLHALRRDSNYAALVLDATPTRLPVFCASDYYPVNNIPSSAERILVIEGKRDENVPPEDSDRLAKKVRDGHGKSVLLDVAHPVPTPGPDLTARFDSILSFFAQP